MDVDRGVRERDGLDQPSLCRRRGRADAIGRKGRDEIVESRRFAIARQMKEDIVRGRSTQVALSDPPSIHGCSGRSEEGRAHGLYGRKDPVFRQQIGFSLQGKLIESPVQLPGCVKLGDEAGKGGEIGLEPRRVNDCALVYGATQQKLGGGGERGMVDPVVERGGINSRDEGGEDCEPGG